MTADTAPNFAGKKKPRPLRCGHCVKLWINNGRKPADMPEAISPANIPEKCPHCGNHFRSVVA